MLALPSTVTVRMGGCSGAHSNVKKKLSGLGWPDTDVDDVEWRHKFTQTDNPNTRKNVQKMRASSAEDLT